MTMQPGYGVDATFGALLRQFRLAAGLSQEQLAERARMSASGISALERRLRYWPQRDTLALLAEALDLDPLQRRQFDAAATRPRFFRRDHAVHDDAGLSDGVPKTNVPFPLSRLVGREVEINAVRTLGAERRLVTLTGAAGIGKTRTALEIAAGAGDDEVWFVELAAVSDPALVEAAVAAVLSVEQREGTSLDVALGARLRARTTLLVLDNCEHVVAEAGRVAGQLLRRCRGLRVIATSREPLRLMGEHVLRLGPLKQESAVALFFERAHAANHHLVLSAETAALAAKICARLEGIPLAIELAAARTSSLSLAVILEKLGQRLSLLTGGGRTGPDRHRTLLAAIDWSYQLLAENEQRLFARMGIFAAACNLEALAAVCCDDREEEDGLLDTVSSLIDKSLVVVDVRHDDQRYLLLDVFREYGRREIGVDAAGEHALRRRYAAWVGKVAAGAREAYYVSSRELWLRNIEPKIDHVFAAIQWALAPGGDTTMAARIVGDLHALWFRRFVGQAEGWIQACLERCADDTPLEVVAQLWYTRAQLGGREALDAAERAVRMFSELDQRFYVARSLLQVALAQSRLGRLEDAEATLRDVLARYDALGLTNSVSAVNATAAHAEILLMLGRFDAAEKLFESTTLERTTTLNDPLRAAENAISYASLTRGRGDPRARLALIEQAIPLVTESRELEIHAAALEAATACHIELAEFGEATRTMSAAIRLVTEIGGSTGATILAQAAIVAARSGNLPAAFVLCGYCETVVSARTEHFASETFEVLLAELQKLGGGEDSSALRRRGGTMDEGAALDLALRTMEHVSTADA